MVHWWKKVFFPVKKAPVSAVTSRVNKTRKIDHVRAVDVGLAKLYNDVQTCAYNDVQVMWEILRRSEMEIQISSSSVSSPAKRRRSFEKIFLSSPPDLSISRSWVGCVCREQKKKCVVEAQYDKYS
ncbi:hypothetical protein ZOSMA_140G00100 [Zostera marina]|uniref:Uncharacterized protein n=1 Tax=Zostera marina TaxID=29655 RepID=A0A0K9PZV6_ZOSMR|nr:hypothetical protein ZOSMA_140G00100 [Zostera marina]